VSTSAWAERNCRRPFVSDYLKLRNIRLDPRVTLSIESDVPFEGFIPYLVVKGSPGARRRSGPKWLRKITNGQFPPPGGNYPRFVMRSRRGKNLVHWPLGLVRLKCLVNLLAWPLAAGGRGVLTCASCVRRRRYGLKQRDHHWGSRGTAIRRRPCLRDLGCEHLGPGLAKEEHLGVPGGERGGRPAPAGHPCPPVRTAADDH